MVPDRQLTTREVKQLARMWRAKQDGTILSGIQKVHRWAIGLAIVFLAFSTWAIVGLRSPDIGWFCGFCMGLCTAVAGTFKSRIEKWPVIEHITDWEEVRRLVELGISENSR
jgi:hypothetical protein